MTTPSVPDAMMNYLLTPEEVVEGLVRVAVNNDSTALTPVEPTPLGPTRRRNAEYLELACAAFFHCETRENLMEIRYAFRAMSQDDWDCVGFKGRILYTMSVAVSRLLDKAEARGFTQVEEDKRANDNLVFNLFYWAGEKIHDAMNDRSLPVDLEDDLHLCIARAGEKSLRLAHANLRTYCEKIMETKKPLRSSHRIAYCWVDNELQNYKDAREFGYTNDRADHPYAFMVNKLRELSTKKEG